VDRSLRGLKLTGEQFQPISVKDPTLHPWRFRLRCLVDLQLATISRRLRPAISGLNGRILDVGAGQAPWRAWLPVGASYQGIDVANSDDFGMRKAAPDIVYYDGTIMPFDDASFEGVLCIEVLEHVSDPELLLTEISRVLTNDGRLILTVPWSARRHHIPYDFQRFTRERLKILLVESGFSQIEIMERGTDVGAIANKLIVMNLRWLKPRASSVWFFSAVVGFLCLPVTAAFVLLAHASEYLDLGGSEDPLGYFVQATRAHF
jgi:SAM-dependent methyltransferase